FGSDQFADLLKEAASGAVKGGYLEYEYTQECIEATLLNIFANLTNGVPVEGQDPMGIMMRALEHKMGPELMLAMKMPQGNCYELLANDLLQAAMPNGMQDIVGPHFVKREFVFNLIRKAVAGQLEAHLKGVHKIYEKPKTKDAQIEEFAFNIAKSVGPELWQAIGTFAPSIANATFGQQGKATVELEMAKELRKMTAERGIGGRLIEDLLIKVLNDGLNNMAEKSTVEGKPLTKAFLQLETFMAERNLNMAEEVATFDREMKPLMDAIERLEALQNQVLEGGVVSLDEIERLKAEVDKLRESLKFDEKKKDLLVKFVWFSRDLLNELGFEGASSLPVAPQVQVAVWNVIVEVGFPNLFLGMYRTAWVSLDPNVEDATAALTLQMAANKGTETVQGNVDTLVSKLSDAMKGGSHFGVDAAVVEGLLKGKNPEERKIWDLLNSFLEGRLKGVFSHVQKEGESPIVSLFNVLFTDFASFCEENRLSINRMVNEEGEKKTALEVFGPFVTQVMAKTGLDRPEAYGIPFVGMTIKTKLEKEVLPTLLMKVYKDIFEPLQLRQDLEDEKKKILAQSQVGPHAQAILSEFSEGLRQKLQGEYAKGWSLIAAKKVRESIAGDSDQLDAYYKEQIDTIFHSPRVQQIIEHMPEVIEHLIWKQMIALAEDQGVEMVPVLFAKNVLAAFGAHEEELRLNPEKTDEIMLQVVDTLMKNLKLDPAKDLPIPFKAEIWESVAKPMLAKQCAGLYRDLTLTYREKQMHQASLAKTGLAQAAEKYADFAMGKIDFDATDVLIAAVKKMGTAGEIAAYDLEQQRPAVQEFCQENLKTLLSDQVVASGGKQAIESIILKAFDHLTFNVDANKEEQLPFLNEVVGILTAHLKTVNEVAGSHEMHEVAPSVMQQAFADRSLLHAAMPDTKLLAALEQETDPAKRKELEQQIQEDSDKRMREHLYVPLTKHMLEIAGFKSAEDLPVPEAVREKTWKALTETLGPDILAKALGAALEPEALNGYITSVLESVHAAITSKEEKTQSESKPLSEDVKQFQEEYEELMRQAARGFGSDVEFLVANIGLLRRAAAGSLQGVVQTVLEEKPFSKMLEEALVAGAAAVNQPPKAKESKKREIVKEIVIDSRKEFEEGIKQHWNGMQDSIDSWVESTFGKLGLDVKHAIDKVFHFVFFDVLGGALNFFFGWTLDLLFDYMIDRGQKRVTTIRKNIAETPIHKNAALHMADAFMRHYKPQSWEEHARKADT
ncbi:MAG: hypothetical protein KDK65_04585, partial [Chlamydiia bacterium]|nr:hypothetical protein [Chlamydiia bacterium]